jgi:hypothetical protein
MRSMSRRGRGRGVRTSARLSLRAAGAREREQTHDRRRTRRARRSVVAARRCPAPSMVGLIGDVEGQITFYRSNSDSTGSFAFKKDGRRIRPVIRSGLRPPRISPRRIPNSNPSPRRLTGGPTLREARRASPTASERARELDTLRALVITVAASGPRVPGDSVGHSIPCIRGGWFRSQFVSNSRLARSLGRGAPRTDSS